MRIRWTPSAIRDIACIGDYIQENDSPASAHNVTLSLYNGINSLTQFPSRGRTGRLNETRESIFTNLPYVAVYRVRKEDVEIIRILHGAQKWP